MNYQPNLWVMHFPALLALGLATLTVSGCTKSPVKFTSGLAIENVSVIYVEEGEVTERQTVVVEGDRIAAVAPASEVHLSEEVQRIDGSGRYLIPGLWDMHAHAYVDEPERLQRMSLAFGVTGVREMGATPEAFAALKEWRRRFRAGEVPGPRLHLAGVIVDGEPPVRPHYLTATNAGEAREAVERLQEMGADFVKVYDRLPAEAFHAIAEAARQHGLEFSGHWPVAVGPAAASDAGVTTLEHADDLGFAVSDLEPAKRPAYVPGLDYILARIQAFKRYDEKKAKTLIDRFADNGTIFVPTLHTVHTFLYQGPEDLEEGPLARLVPEGQKQRVAELPADYIEQNRESFDRAYDNLQRFVGAMHEAGVVLMAGSHAPATPFIPPGYGLHEELVRLAEAGLTPAEALRTATLHSARYLGRLDELGTVEEGKLADLVLLDANPLEDIRHTRRIEAVVLNGRLLDRQTLDRMLIREPTLVVENGRVIVGDGTVLARGTVIVAGERIVSVTEEPISAPNVRRIDASGKTVLPGLIDAHVHITPPPGEQDSESLHRHLEGRLAEELRSFLEHGVTTLRSTGDYWPWSGELRDRIAAGEVLGPRVVTAGPVFTAEGAHPATTVCSPDNSFCRRRLTREITTPAQAQEAVRRVAKAGVDFIKLVSDSRTTGVQIEDKVVEAIVEEAHREGLEAVGHVSEAARMEAYAEMGLDGFVHPPLIPVSDDQTRRLARVLAMHGIPVTSTLVIPLLHTDEPVGPVLEGASPLPESLASMSRSVAVMAEEGVSIVVGSDWFVADRHPALRAGVVTHTEMELLQWGGMSEEAIIRAATANAAQALGLGDRVGTLESGKLADLIVVDGAPLENISALQKVELVVKGGEIVIKADSER